jgi:hypothetical protein
LRFRQSWIHPRHLTLRFDPRRLIPSAQSCEHLRIVRQCSSDHRVTDCKTVLGDVDGSRNNGAASPYFLPVDAHSDAREHLRNQRPDAQQNTLVGFDTDGHSSLLRRCALCGTKACSCNRQRGRQTSGLHFLFHLHRDGREQTGKPATIVIPFSDTFLGGCDAAASFGRSYRFIESVERG